MGQHHPFWPTGGTGCVYHKRQVVFSHIFGGGYAAGYYSYLWAEQLAADAWGRFLEEGELDPAAGQALRKEILSVGASRPALESFVAFRGRRPEPGPLLETYGLNGEE